MPQHAFAHTLPVPLRAGAAKYGPTTRPRMPATPPSFSLFIRRPVIHDSAPIGLMRDIII
ncbi:hypothetical protein AA13755_0427 [Acetobacter peroxydans NBRC 13755]|nr:hypothetical protein AA13755_0427 [Acetobacter peroxydans NBRC 13755]